MMPEVFKIIIKQKPSIMDKARRKKWAQLHGIRLAWINEETQLFGRRAKAHIFLRLTTIFNLSFAISTFLLSSARMHRIYVILCV